MRRGILIFSSLSLSALSYGSLVAQEIKRVSIPFSTKFNNNDYFLRWSQPGQYELTPIDQENLDAWTDMLTIRTYPQAMDGDSLAIVANQVLANYQSSSGKIIRNNSIPKTAAKPAEHFIAAVLGNPKLLEFVETRFLIIDGQGVGVIYSHRVYGYHVGPEMSSWILKNGSDIENVLMEYNPPSISSLSKK